MTQNERLLKSLTRWRSGWWIVTRLHILRVSARVFDLRRQGHQIVSRTIYRGRTRVVSYRLEG